MGKRKSNYIKKAPYNSNIQVDAMKKKFPEFRAKKLSNTNIVFTGEVLVKPELPRYKISVNYKGNNRPIVKVISPSLDENAPHIYPNDKSLCLYHPDNFKWRREKIIANEIMQWTIAWIYFYEYWLQSGVWIGPEAHHGESKKNETDIDQEDD